MPEVTAAGPIGAIAAAIAAAVPNDLTDKVNALIDWLADGVVKAPTFEVDGNPVNFQKPSASEAVIVESGVMAARGGYTPFEFSAAHVITASKFGGGIICFRRDTTNQPMTIAATALTKVPGATQTTPMAYDSAPLAQAAIDLLTPDAGYIKVGEFLIENDAGDWTALTDNMTTDITSIVFTSVAEKVLPTEFA